MFVKLNFVKLQRLRFATHNFAWEVYLDFIAF